MQHNVIGLYEPIFDPRKRTRGVDKNGYYRYDSDADSMLHFFDITSWMAANFVHLSVGELCRILRPMRYSMADELDAVLMCRLDISFPAGYNPASTAHVAELAKVLNIIHVAPFIEPTIDYMDIFERYEMYVRDSNTRSL